jgi:hypothetical protein
MKRRIIQMINRNAVGRFLVELRAEQDISPQNSHAEHRSDYDTIVLEAEEKSSFINRNSKSFAEYITDQLFVPSPAVVETTAVACVYDASDYIVSCDSAGIANGRNPMHFDDTATDQDILMIEGRDILSSFTPPPDTPYSMQDRLYDTTTNPLLDSLNDDTNARYNTQYL